MLHLPRLGPEHATGPRTPRSRPHGTLRGRDRLPTDPCARSAARLCPLRPEAPATTTDPAMPRPAQPLLIRLTHWVNAVLLVVMAGSGLQILVACPQLGEKGRPYGWYPLQGHPPPEALTLGGWLAGARH